MRLERKKQRSRLPIILIGAAILLLAAAATYAYMNRQWPFSNNAKDTAISPEINTVNYDKPDEVQVDAGAAAKERLAPTPDTPTTTNDESAISITTAARNGDTVYIRAIISGATPEGSCNLTMKGPDGKAYTATSSIQALADSSTCQGFNVPFTQLSTGKWSVTVEYLHNSASATTTKEITL